MWAAVLLAGAILARPGYVGVIPNGGKVPGVRRPMATGHVNPQGHGQRNQFGLDFDAVGRKWTKALCEQDSDGDGLSNGEELGNPACVWIKGSTPERTVGITHPGVMDGWQAILLGHFRRIYAGFRRKVSDLNVRLPEL